MTFSHLCLLRFIQNDVRLPCLRWLVANGLTVRLDYGIPLVSVDNSGNSLQEQGVYFSVRYRKAF